MIKNAVWNVFVKLRAFKIKIEYFDQIKLRR